MSNATPQKFEFQAEIKQLLDIVIHSLYTEKEIFVRELISNASDALEKLRHTQLTEKEIHDEKLELEINVTTDDKAKTLTIQDHGIGMTRAELADALGVAGVPERQRKMRVQQLWHWIYVRGVTEFAQMTSVSSKYSTVTAASGMAG